MDNDEGGTDPTGKDVFDASQYEFFGDNILDDFDLGGLEIEDDEDGIPFPEIGDLGKPVVDLAELDGIEFTIGSEEEDALSSLSVIDDPSSRYLQLNKVVSGPASAGVSGDWGFKESSSAAERAQEADSTNSVDQRAFGAEALYESKNLSESFNSSSAQKFEPNSVQHQTSTEPIHVPNSSSSSYLPHGGPSLHASPNPNSSYQPFVHQMHIPSTNRSVFSNPQLQSTALPRGSRGLSFNHQHQNQWMNQNSAYLRNQHHPHQQSSAAHLRGMQPQMFSSHHPSSPGTNGPPNSSDPRAISVLRNRQGMQMQYPQQGFDFFGQRMYGGGWPRFRGKYMAPHEIENIIRMQTAATQTSDPYVEDYYHQASLARKSAGANNVRCHFCPTQLRDGSFVSSNSSEPHAFLKVEGLGRVALPSIRRPRPLLEVEQPVNSSSSSTGGGIEPLEQEPMLAARFAIENGHYFLLEIDDIDRFLQCNQPPDDGQLLRQRRQLLLESLASFLHLVDPLRKNEPTLNLAPEEDDLVFMRILSLLKGKKLLSRYLQLLSPGELLRVVCMAIFRNLRFLFCSISSDPETSATQVDLARTVSSCVQIMDLKSLAACLASVVCSKNLPHLPPIGSSHGDGASVVLKSVLERATEVLTSSNADGGCCSPANRMLWQASFDAFFGLVMEYCGNKYDSVLQYFASQSAGNHPSGTSVGADVAKAITREIPIELLRASLPHTNEQQKQVLLDFSKRSMPVDGF